MRFPLVVPAAVAMLLAGCSAPGVPGGGGVTGAAPADRGARIAAECRLLDAARGLMLARALPTPPDIVVGCPGHEALRDAMPLAAQSAALRAANSAALPPAVAAAGPVGARIYRRMITRGVPEAVAAEVADGPLWRRAVAAAGS